MKFWYWFGCLGFFLLLLQFSGKDFGNEMRFLFRFLSTFGCRFLCLVIGFNLTMDSEVGVWMCVYVCVRGGCDWFSSYWYWFFRFEARLHWNKTEREQHDGSGWVGRALRMVRIFFLSFHPGLVWWIGNEWTCFGGFVCGFRLLDFFNAVLRYAAVLVSGLLETNTKTKHGPEPMVRGDGWREKVARNTKKDRFGECLVLSQFWLREF